MKRREEKVTGLEFQDIESDCTDSTKIVGDEVTNHEDEESDVKEITNTHEQRMEPRGRVQRSYESEIKVDEEETMRGSVKSALVILGETSEDTVVLHCQETDKNSNAYYFSTMVRKLRKFYMP